MLSILIPTYNYCVYDLVFELKNQCDSIGITYEIICQDDNSTIYLDNEKINQLHYCLFIKNTENLGRSKNRNTLSQKAKFQNLLFLDADTFPVHKNFIANYIAEINNNYTIVNGGIVYQTEKPPKEKLLRWVYGIKREALSVEKRNENGYLSFLTLNFLIHKDVFKTVIFNESIPNLRHEDTLFSYNLMQNKILIKNIENPVFHYGIDNFDRALIKEHESLSALKNLTEKGLLSQDYVKISKLYFTIKSLHCIGLIVFSFKIIKPLLLKNMSNSNPSLLVFDIYRIGYLCLLKD